MTQPTVQTAEEAAVALRDEMCAIGRQFQDEGGDAQAFYDSAIILCIERHIAARDAAIRADELGKVLEWRSVETAPRDGSWIIGLLADRADIFRISWGKNYRDEFAWCSAGGSFVPGAIAYWMPFPSPPLQPTKQANNFSGTAMRASTESTNG